MIVKSIESVHLKCYDDSVYDPQIHHPVEGVLNRPYQYGYCWMVENNNGKMPSLEDVRQCFFNIVRLYMSEKQKGREWDVGGSEQDMEEFNNVAFWDKKIPKSPRNKKNQPIDPQILADPFSDLTKALIFAMSSVNCVSFYIKCKMNHSEKNCLMPIGPFLVCIEQIIQYAEFNKYTKEQKIHMSLQAKYPLFKCYEGFTYSKSLYNDYMDLYESK